MRYGLRLGCRFGMPHDPMIVYENKRAKWEKCQRCGEGHRWNKGFRGRIDNINYLKFHVAAFAQEFGRTKRIFYKMYKPSKLIIRL